MHTMHKKYNRYCVAFVWHWSGSFWEKMRSLHCLRSMAVCLTRIFSFLFAVCERRFFYCCCCCSAPWIPVCVRLADEHRRTYIVHGFHNDRRENQICIFGCARAIISDLGELTRNYYCRCFVAPLCLRMRKINRHPKASFCSFIFVVCSTHMHTPSHQPPPDNIANANKMHLSLWMLRASSIIWLLCRRRRPPVLPDLSFSPGCSDNRSANIPYAISFRTRRKSLFPLDCRPRPSIYTLLWQSIRPALVGRHQNKRVKIAR